MLALVGLLLAAASAPAAQPLLSEDAATLGRGHLQAEWGLESREETASALAAREASSSLTLSWGAAEDLDLQAGLIALDRREEGAAELGGLGDLELALKWRCLRRGPYSLALKPSLRCPTAQAGLGGSGALAGALLAGSLEGASWALNLNLGWARDLGPDLGSRRDLLSASASTLLPLAGPLSLALEGGLQQDPAAESLLWPASSTLGVIWALGDFGEIGLGLHWQASPDAFSRSLLAGLSLWR